MTTDNATFAPYRAARFVGSSLVWPARVSVGAVRWAYRRLAGDPEPLTRGQEKRRRKAVARAAGVRRAGNCPKRHTP
jgi:hypothetical protein